MNVDKVFSIAASIIVLATVTVVLTSKNTVGVTTGIFSGFTNTLKTAMGR